MYEDNDRNEKDMCNSLSPPLADIVCFGPLRIVVNLTVLKCCLRARGFHTLMRNALFTSPTDLGSHNAPPLGAQHPHWCPMFGSDNICNSLSSLLADIVHFDL